MSVIGKDGITSQECATFLDFAATFLSNVGNYYVRLPCCAFMRCIQMLSFDRGQGIRSLCRTLVIQSR